MSETPKAKTPAKKPATKKAVRADSTNADKPVKAVKKAPAKKAPAKKAPAKTEAVVAGTPEVPAVVWADVAEQVAPKKNFWAKLVAFFKGE